MYILLKVKILLLAIGRFTSQRAEGMMLDKAPNTWFQEGTEGA
jgi:hypothetical protein